MQKAQFDRLKHEKRRAYDLKKKQNKAYRKAMEQHWVHKLNKENSKGEQNV